MNQHRWDTEERGPLDMAGTAARNLLVGFGCTFALACSAQVDPTSIAAHVLGDEAPWVVKLCAAMMAICLGIIWWQQKELVAQTRQSRGDFREMIRVASKFLDHIEKDTKPISHGTYVDHDVAELIERRLRDGKRSQSSTSTGTEAAG